MNEEIVTGDSGQEEQPQVNFYKLNKSKPYSIFESKKQSKDRNIISDYTLTDGRITEFKCVERYMRSSIESTNSICYVIDFVYTFYDKNLNLRSGKFHSLYTIEPPFYKGQYLMIAFNEIESFILREFTLEKDDECKLKENENLRSADDFDGISGEIFNVDLNRPIKGYQNSFVWFLAAFMCFFFAAAYTIPISILVVPNIFVGFIFPDLLALIAVYLFPLMLIAFILWSLKKYFKIKNNFNKVIKRSPIFTYGKVFASKATYRGSIKKQAFYCFIDKFGEKHKKKLAFSLLRKNIQDEKIDVIVAYTSAGDSTIILDCKFADEE